MPLADFVVYVFLAFGVLIHQDAFLDAHVRDIRFVSASEMSFPGACAETEMVRWRHPDGTETREINQIRVVWPDQRPLCPARALPSIVGHELECHARIFLLEGDTGSSHTRPGCAAVIYVTPE